ncbi:tetratricopeptide repeat protein [Aquimarina sp. W85]|uniref:tetratricopeptide repeat protein n=1 Tax=Aquimarina rhodophyticola TaxID=3342246 RepID=UPI00366CAE91
MITKFQFFFFLILLSVTSSFVGQETKGDLTFPHTKKMDSVILYYKQQLLNAQLESSSKVGLRYLDLGEFYFSAGVISEAVEQFSKGLHTIKDPNDTLQVILKNAIGRVELSLKNYAQAQIYFNEAINESMRLKYKRGQAISKSYLGSCYEKKQEYDIALTYQEESLKLFDELQDIKGLSLVNENMGSIYEDLEYYDLAFQYFNRAYNLVKGQLSRNEISILNNLGDIYRKKGDYKKALTTTHKALVIARIIEDTHQLISANKDISKTHLLLKDYKQAFLYLSEAEDLNQKHFYTQNTNQFNVLQAVYESDKKEAQIKLLKQENATVSVRHKLFLVLLGVGFLIVGGTYSLIHKRRKAKLKIQKFEKQLLETELEKKALQEKNLQNEIQLKTAALSKYSLHLSQKNKVMQNLSANLKKMADRKHLDMSKKLKALAIDIDESIHYEQEWTEFVNYFSDIHPNFIERLLSYSIGKLSPAELRLAILLRLNLTSKEIAAILRITPDSIRVSRYRLRKKISIGKKQDLVQFLFEL